MRSWEMKCGMLIPPLPLSLSKARHCPLVTKRWSYCKYINRAHVGRIQSLWIKHQSPQNNKQFILKIQRKVRMGVSSYYINIQ